MAMSDHTPSGTAQFGDAQHARGTNQAGVRLYNERLILSLIRRGGGVPKAEIARLTGLSPQTTTVIVNRLEAEGLILRSERRRGRVGQPAVPYRLNPDGALAYGLKIGRRSTDLVLVDFFGRVRARLRAIHAYPTPDELKRFLGDGLSQIAATLPPAHRARIAGLGIATPFELWNWQSEVGARPEIMAQWRTFDTAGEMRAIAALPVWLCNDGTAATAAEQFFGAGDGLTDVLYVFIGSFVGGGLVLNGSIVQGRRGNAGAIGSFPVPNSEGRSAQLIRRASLHVLERKLREAGQDTAPLWRTPVAWPDFGPTLTGWIDDTARALALLAASAAAIMDFEAVVIDGAMPAEVRSDVVAATERHFFAMDRQGLSPLRIGEGTIGPDARAIGGAALPLMALFARDREVLFKEVGA